MAAQDIRGATKRTGLTLIAAAAVTVGGAYGGIALAEATMGTATLDNEVYGDQPPRAANPDYPRNGQGLTYGTVAKANVPEEEPNLILVVSDGGQEGFVYAEQLNPPDFKSPHEALEWQDVRYARDFVLDVYESDGTTKIGTFTIPAIEK